MFHRRNVQPVVSGDVLCLRQGRNVDVEKCFSCPLQRGLESGADGGVRRVSCVAGRQRLRDTVLIARA